MRALSKPHHRARLLRRNQTDAEALLWSRLRAGRFSSANFRRQFPIGVYIADFACREHHLVIELDGGQHADRAAADTERTRLLADRGWRVIRFWNNDVLTNLDGVLEVIAAELGTIETPPLPNPLPSQGEGTGENFLPSQREGTKDARPRA